jgi:WD40 repeat protein
MKWFVLMFVALLPVVAAGQVPGVELVYKDATVLAQPQPVQAGQIVVGDKLVGIFHAQNQGRLTFYHFDGSPDAPILDPAFVRCAVAVDQDLYMGTSAYGFNVLRDGAVIQNISGPRMNEVDKLAVTPDGRTIVMLQALVPTLSFWDRDPKTGKITKTGQVFQADDAGLVNIKGSYERRGKPVPIEKGAVRVADWGDPYDMRISADGNLIFFPVISQACAVFSRDGKGWKHLATLRDALDGFHKYGMSINMSLAQHGEDVFVGGIKRLAWLKFDGKKLTSKRFFVDDSEPPGHEYETVPYFDQVTGLTISKNGKYLFSAGGDVGGGITVLKIGKDDLELVGKTKESPGDVMIEVELSRDGKHLFANSRSCLLMIYDLDATFTK